MRTLGLTLVIAFTISVQVEAGLQSALTSVLVLGETHSAIPEGALFIDPIESTFGEGVFRHGPTFEYDPNTGGVQLFAPPMLGPADEFGVRGEYSPRQIEIVGGEHLAEPVTLPSVIRHSRNRIDYYSIYLEPIVFSDSDPSFIDDSDSGYHLSVYDDVLELNSYSFREFSGIELDFQSLLNLGLDFELFDASERILLPNAIWPYIPRAESSIPEIHFVIHYETDYAYGHLAPEHFSLLAVPQSLLEGSSSVPEPHSVLLALLAITAHVRTRRTLQ